MAAIPSEREIEQARRRVEELLDRHGLLLMHDAELPSATAAIAGAPVRGSWWGHPQGKLIFETLNRLEDTVAWAKLVLGKETLVHRRLWPALVAAAASGQPWQIKGLRTDAKRLLQRIRRGSRVMADREHAAASTDLERRLLAHGTSEHTPSGRHVRFLETWGAWARRSGVAAAGLPDAAEALEALSAPVMAWARPEGEGRRRPGLLPWLAAR